MMIAFSTDGRISGANIRSVLQAPMFVKKFAGNASCTRATCFSAWM
jgi:hypothetical protein